MRDIVHQMQLRNFHHAQGIPHRGNSPTGAVVLAVLNGFGYVKLQPKAAVYAADIVGGLLLGAEYRCRALAPGTTLAQDWHRLS